MKQEIYNEAEIVAGCVRNERASQEKLYRRHFPKMMALCMRHTNGDQDRAIEILNDGFLRIFKKIDTFEFKGSLEGWIRRLVFHAVSDYFRAQKTYLDSIVFSEFDRHDFADLQNAPLFSQNTEGVFPKLYFDDLLKMVDELPPSTRDVFVLFAIEGYKHEEIAKQLGISVGTSKWHLANARERLKTLILKNEDLV